MHFTELDPVWLTHKRLEGYGVRFRCPHCNCQIPILFLNPANGDKPLPNDPQHVGNNHGYRWSRSGLKFEEMSLAPSIQLEGHGHWHVINGQVTNA